MIKTICVPLLFLSFFLIFNTLIAQQVEKDKITQLKNPKLNKEIRGKNVVTGAVGVAVLNGDFSDNESGLFAHIGYKRFLGSYVNINFGVNVFKLANKDVFDEGFTSFDLNLEVYILPFEVFSPYVYVGGGYIRQNDKRLDGKSFTDTKAQGGGGVELLVSSSVGIKLFAEYNIISSDDLDGIVSGDSNDGFWRGGFGINYYFGNSNRTKKIKDDAPTFIKSKQIENKD